MNGFKKFLNFILIVIGVLLIVACADLLTNKTMNKSYEDMSSLDQEAVSELGNIINLFDSRKGNSDVWDNNYNLCDTGCVISRLYGPLKGRSYAVNVDLSGNIFAQRITMPDSYSSIPVYRLAFCTPQTLSLYGISNDEIYIDIGDENVYAVKYDVSKIKYNGSGSMEESFVKTTFKTAVETEDSPTVDTSINFAITEENVALTGLQYRIIDDMLRADSLDKMNELVYEYVLVREFQSEKHPDFAKQQETIELTDGRTQFVFYNVSDLIGHNITYFNKEKSDSITFYSAYHYLCTGRYNSDVSEYFNYTGNVYVGAALCEVLQNQRIVANWKNRLDNSTNSEFVSPYSLIKEYSDSSSFGGAQYSDRTLDDIKREYNYEEILNMAKALVQGNTE